MTHPRIPALRFRKVSGTFLPRALSPSTAALPQAGIQRIPKTVAQQVKSQNETRDKQTRNHRHAGGISEVRTCIADDTPESRHLGRNTNPKKVERGLHQNGHGQYIALLYNQNGEALWQ
jgi:hypothetical protein